MAMLCGSASGGSGRALRDTGWRLGRSSSRLRPCRVTHRKSKLRHLLLHLLLCCSLRLLLLSQVFQEHSNCWVHMLRLRGCGWWNGIRTILFPRLGRR